MIGSDPEESVSSLTEEGNNPAGSLTTIETALSRIGNDRAALAIFTTAGYPDRDATVDILQAISEGGADIIEIGVPFSDPIADGPVIQHSSDTALRNGTNLTHVLKAVSDFRDVGGTTPVVLMGYANSFFQFGLERFSQQAAQAGINGVLVVDLPVEVSGKWKPYLQRHGIAMVLLASPTTTPDRMKLIAQSSQGYLYCVSLKGVTGAGNFDATSVGNLVLSLREMARIPILVGFGIRTPEQARLAAKCADGIVVGSGIIELIGKARPDDIVSTVTSYVQEMRRACERK